MSCHNTKIWNFLQDFNGFLAIMIYASWMQKGISKQSVISQFMKCNLIFWEFFTSHTRTKLSQKEILTFVMLAFILFVISSNV